jgi:hypothetical protein
MVSCHLSKADEFGTTDEAGVISQLRPCMISPAAQHPSR